MPSDRVSLFLAAKRVLRAHGDWTDEQVAEHIGLHPLLIPDVLPAARTEVEQDG